MTNVLSAYRPWLAAAILSSTAVLSACGGGGGANSVPQAELPSSSWNDNTEPAPSTGTQPGDGAQRPDSSAGLDSSPDISAPTDPNAGISPIVPDDDAEPKSPPTVDEADGSVVLMWSRPEQRENGDYLEGDEIGGYEIRYRTSEQDDYEIITIDDGWQVTYEFTDLVGPVQFQISAYDRDGLYSKFVDIRPRG